DRQERDPAKDFGSTSPAFVTGSRLPTSKTACSRRMTQESAGLRELQHSPRSVCAGFLQSRLRITSTDCTSTQMSTCGADCTDTPLYFARLRACRRPCAK